MAGERSLLTRDAVDDFLPIKSFGVFQPLSPGTRKPSALADEARDRDDGHAFGAGDREPSKTVRAQIEQSDIAGRFLTRSGSSASIDREFACAGGSFARRCVNRVDES
jgi:hypothetical protein